MLICARQCRQTMSCCMEMWWWTRLNECKRWICFVMTGVLCAGWSRCWAVCAVSSPFCPTARRTWGKSCRPSTTSSATSTTASHRSPDFHSGARHAVTNTNQLSSLQKSFLLFQESDDLGSLIAWTASQSQHLALKPQFRSVAHIVQV